MLYRTDNPIADFHRWDAEQNNWIATRPVCADCGEAIQEDYYYLINDEAICPNCIEAYRHGIDDFIV
jgi:formylmethanofuran dehydrogenase subunit E